MLHTIAAGALAAVTPLPGVRSAAAMMRCKNMADAGFRRRGSEDPLADRFDEP